MVALLLIAACASSAPIIRVRSDQSQYAWGDRVFVTVTNGTRDTVLNDRCGGEVQDTRDGRTWKANFGRECDDFGRGWRARAQIIPPGASRVDTLTAMPADTGVGRVKLLLRDTQGRLLADTLRESNTFKVGGRTR